MPELRERLPFHAQRIALAKFVQAIGASPTALVRDGSGDLVISGLHGDVYALPAGFELFVACRTPRDWAAAKGALSFALLRKDGAEEGLLWLSRLPKPDEALAILIHLGIPKRVDAEPSRRRERFSGRLAGGDFLFG
jgi:hypothetical protein